MSNKPEEASLTNEGVAYEKNDVNVGVLVISAVAILTITLLAMAFILVFMGGVETQRDLSATPPPVMLDARPTPPLPRLQPNPIDGATAEDEVMATVEQQEKILTTYAWVSKDNRVARVPIDTAIELLTLGEEAPKR
jgi:hypothetical protein